MKILGMKKIETRIPGVFILEFETFGDERGKFFEYYNKEKFAAIGIHDEFVQNSYARSAKGVLRGLHFQFPPHEMSKLVRCNKGRLWDVAVDMRTDSPTYKQWVGVELTDSNNRMLYLPKGCAHGFYALEDCELIYGVGHNVYNLKSDANFRWDDPEVNIQWPLDGVPILSERDKKAPFLKEVSERANRKPMRILLTGSNGNLGSAIVKEAQTFGYDVIPTTSKDMDITNPESIKKTLDEYAPDAIINTAAYNFVDAIEDPMVYPTAFAINAEGPRLLAREAAKRDIPIVHVSTDYVFDGEKHEGYTESDIPNPISMYGITKYLGEKAVQQEGGQWYICRTSKIFGPKGTSEMSKKSFVTLISELAKTKPELDITDEEEGNPTYTKDLAKSLLTLIAKEFPSGIYHLVNEDSAVTFYEFSKEIFSLTESETPFKPVKSDAFPPRPAKRPKFASLINTKFPPLRSRKEALKEFLATEE